MEKKPSGSYKGKPFPSLEGCCLSEPDREVDDNVKGSVLEITREKEGVELFKKNLRWCCFEKFQFLR